VKYGYIFGFITTGKEISMFYEVMLLGNLIWNVPLLVFLISISIVYSFVLQHFTNIRIYHKKPLFFFLSLILLQLLIGSPLTAFGHLSFSIHMIQMSILFFIIPPLLLAGIPKALLELTFKLPLVKKISKLFLSPMLALFLFSLLFFLYHVPVILGSISQSTFSHNGFLVLLFILSIQIWWPIVSPDPKQRFYNEQRKRYLFLNGFILMPACILFIWNGIFDNVQNPFMNQVTALMCLPPQADTTNLLPSLFSTKYDQILGGALMLVIHKFSLIHPIRPTNPLEGDVD
jgi:cytochrome c oxidase assembly factor CtaG